LLVVVVPRLARQRGRLPVAVQVVEDERRAEKLGERRHEWRIGDEVRVRRHLQLQDRRQAVGLGIDGAGDGLGAQALVHPASTSGLSRDTRSSWMKPGRMTYPSRAN
jgi:hypothetical protein